MSQCTTIKNAKKDFHQKKKSKPKNTNNRNTQNNNNKHTRFNDNNNIQHEAKSTSNNNKKNSASSSDEESVNELDDSPFDSVYAININNNDVSSTELRVQVTSPNKQPYYLLGLLDTGAGGAYIKRSALAHIDHTVEDAVVQLQGRYSTVQATQTAIFTIKLPCFTSAKEIKIRAFVEDGAQGRHDIILGRTVCKQLGLKFDFQLDTVTWDDKTISMLKKGSLNPHSINNIDSQDVTLPQFMQKSTRHLDCITPNKYQEHNYKNMVLKCSHLTSLQQQILLQVVGVYDELFSGTLGAVPNVKVHLQLKPNAVPYFAKAYTIPQKIYAIAKAEVEELVQIGVLLRNRPSPWAAPCLFRPKKDGGVWFLSDLRKLNEQLVHNPYPLPNIDGVIFSMKGFTFATCLDLNRGYYHFMLDDASQLLCGIILPWGHYVYARLPQGCKPSSDIFQCHMAMIFGDFEDVVVFIDNILLFTKLSFEHHVK